MMWLGARRGRNPEGRSSRIRIAALLLAAPFFSNCYSEGNGKSPPSAALYYPTGLTVSPGGNALFVANSDFDLQYKGGTLQSYDLFRIRADAAKFAIVPPPGCPFDPNVTDANGKRIPLGQTCAPPVDSLLYQKDSVVIGAFASDLMRSRKSLPTSTGVGVYRLLLPVRGDASLTWANVRRDDEGTPYTPEPNGPNDPVNPIFRIDCGDGTTLGDATTVRRTGDFRCDEDHHAGRRTDPGNPTVGLDLPEDKQLALPGEPFGAAQSYDGRLLVTTHQTEAKASLFDTGIRTKLDPADSAKTIEYYDRPSLKYVLVDGLQLGGTGVAAVPEDPIAYPQCNGTPAANKGCTADLPAFYSTNRVAPQLTLLRAYPDISTGQFEGDDNRPILVKEGAAGIVINASGIDSRDVFIDRSPRVVCEKQLRLDNEKLPTPKTDAELATALASCARRPARIYITNRSPASLLVGELGDGAVGQDGSYSGTRVNLQATVPLAAGPSRVYVAPIVDDAGLYALRVFIVCFDSRTVFVFNPDRNALENIIRTADGPFALTFDPFDLDTVVDTRLRGIKVPEDTRYVWPPADPAPPQPYEVKKYRFAYLASFTRSFVQVIDLDNSRADKSTFETVVFSMGLPLKPVGSK